MIEDDGIFTSPTSNLFQLALTKGDEHSCLPGATGKLQAFSVLNIPISEVFKITKKDILNFAETYIGSPEERADVLKSYVDGQGDLGFVIDHIMLSTEADLETWRWKLFEKGISSN